MHSKSQKTVLKTLLVAATVEEIAPTLEHFGWQRSSFVEGIDVDVLITGVGLTATAFAMGQKLNSQYGLVLNAGVAGSFDRTLPLGSLVNISTDTFSELGAEDGEDFIGIDELGFGKSTYTSTFTSEIDLIADLPSVNGISVNKVHGHTKTIQQTLKRLTIQTESMEGAAVFYACEQLHIPVLQVRSISNYVEQRNRESWNIPLAIKNLNEWLINYLTL